MILTGDCVELMRGLEPASVDAIVTDPPYGLEFMGKEWDRFRVDDPGTMRHRGERAGVHGEITDGSDSNRHSRVGYGGGKRPATFRCVRCGKRDQFRNPHGCDVEWRRELIDPHAAPPTMLAFQEWSRIWALEAKRVLKPGGHLLAFGGTRTYHRLACAIEDAGFEIRDCLAWMFGSGFPKSLDVSKAIDKAAGVEREVVGPNPNFRPNKEAHTNGIMRPMSFGEAEVVSAPATPEAERWQGWGTALKPAHEPIVVARKPLAGTVAGNVLEHGTGALNVDGCRVGDTVETWPSSRAWGAGYVPGGDRTADRTEATGEAPAGRWPANVVLDEEAAAMLDEQTGEIGPSFRQGDRSLRNGQRQTYGRFSDPPAKDAGFSDSGGASRFFYTAKSSRAERNAGLEGFEERETPWLHDDGRAHPRPLSDPRMDRLQERRPTKNTHPTVKPVALMRWLVRLVTPPGGLVLDPFSGSGTTGIAAALEGFQFVGMEQDAEYAKIAEARIAFWAEHGEEGLRIVAERERAEAEREAIVASGQLELLL